MRLAVSDDFGSVLLLERVGAVFRLISDDLCSFQGRVTGGCLMRSDSVWGVRFPVFGWFYGDVGCLCPGCGHVSMVVDDCLSDYVG